LGKLLARAKKEGLVSDNPFSDRIIAAMQNYMSSERATNSTAKQAAQSATSSDAFLAINVLMVFLQHSLHSSGQMK